MPAERAALRARVLAALETVVDPCSEAAGCPAGLASMGLVRSLEIAGAADAAKVRVRLGVTDPGCLMGAVFITRARTALQKVAGIAELDLALAPVIDWRPDDMQPAYHARLDRHRAAKGIAPGTGGQLDHRRNG